MGRVQWNLAGSCFSFPSHGIISICLINRTDLIPTRSDRERGWSSSYIDERNISILAQQCFIRYMRSYKTPFQIVLGTAYIWPKTQATCTILVLPWGEATKRWRRWTYCAQVSNCQNQVIWSWRCFVVVVWFFGWFGFSINLFQKNHEVLHS